MITFGTHPGQTIHTDGAVYMLRRSCSVESPHDIAVPFVSSLPVLRAFQVFLIIVYIICLRAAQAQAPFHAAYTESYARYLSIFHKLCRSFPAFLREIHSFLEFPPHFSSRCRCKEGRREAARLDDPQLVQALSGNARRAFLLAPIFHVQALSGSARTANVVCRERIPSVPKRPEGVPVGTHLPRAGTVRKRPRRQCCL